MKKRFIISLLVVTASFGWAEASLKIDWENSPERRWAGPHLWTNRLQDWRVKQGKLFLEETGRLGSASVLTHTLSDRAEPFEMQTRFAYVKMNEGLTGMLVGAGEGKLDPRGAALVHGKPGVGGGLLAVVNHDAGELQFIDMGADTDEYLPVPGQQVVQKLQRLQNWTVMDLKVTAEPTEGESYRLTLAAFSQDGKLLGETVLENYPANRLQGGVAIAARGKQWQNDVIFHSIELGGSKFDVDPKQTSGPVVGTLFTVADGILKLAVQGASLGDGKIPNSGKGGPRTWKRITAELEGRPAGTEEPWKKLAEPLPLMQPHYHVLFRVEGWDSSRDWETRVIVTDSDGTEFTYDTFIPAEPDGKRLVVGTFSCMGASAIQANMPRPKTGPGERAIARWSPAAVWAPWNEIVESMDQHNPDILFFTGDQIYEGFPTVPENNTNPVEDYLYKFFIWHLAFRDLTSKTPAVLQLDDHDIYMGNLWGDGARFNLTGQDWDGGMEMSPVFVNLAIRSMTAHLPDTIKPLEINTGVFNYYTDFTYGGVDFFIAEDRKFKAAPGRKDTDEWDLFGKDQTEAIRRWTDDDKGLPKMFVSQTIYASQSVDFDGEFFDAELDSNCWPPEARDAFIRDLAKAKAVILSGDQHLATMAQVGVDKPSDGVFQFAAPPAGNIYWRWFYPAEPGANRDPGMPEFLGDFEDKQGNPFRMLAVANPESPDMLDRELRKRIVIDEASYEAGIGRTRHTCQGQGYGVAFYDFDAGTVTFEAWPYLAYPENHGSPFPGWPVTIDYKNNELVK